MKNNLIIIVTFLLSFIYCKTEVCDCGGRSIGEIKLINQTNYDMFFLDNPATIGDDLDKRMKQGNVISCKKGDTLKTGIIVQMNQKDTSWIMVDNERTIFFGSNRRLRLWDKSNFSNKDTVQFKYKSFHNIYKYTFNKTTDNLIYTYTFTEKDVLLADTFIN